METKLTDLIAPSFFCVHHDIKEDLHTHYWLKGGRGSCKSSFVSVEIIMGLIQYPDSNAVVIRKVGMYLKDSVFEQIKWVIDKTETPELWQIKLSPLEIVYLPTGQKILFRGADKPKKLKSTKVSKGYIRYVWYEEVDEFFGMEEIRTINQSLLRGGKTFTVFYSYNPPKSVRSWVNREVSEVSDDKMVHHSTYMEVPKDWLGNQFFIEAQHLKKINEKMYTHEYLGMVTGTGGEIFTNVTVREIEEDEIELFDNIKRGIDFGYAADPFVYIVCHFDRKYQRLYIFDEICKTGLSNNAASNMILSRSEYNSPIVCDSAEPKSIRDLRERGLRVIGAKKGPDSIEYGIKFLQSLEEIIIDGVKCPNVKREFLNYELQKDSNGDFKSSYPDKDNHTIDAARYALEDEINNKKAKVIKRSDFGI